MLDALIVDHRVRSASSPLAVVEEVSCQGGVVLLMLLPVLVKQHWTLRLLQ